MRTTDQQSFSRRYQIQSTLGRGGMGTVFRVHDRLGGQVALKRMSAARRGSSEGAPSARGSSTPAPGLPAEAGPLVLDADLALSFATQTSAPEETVFGSSPSEPSSRPGPLLDASHAAATAQQWRLILAREFRLLSSLRHPNIISVLDYGFDADFEPYFTMELLEGAQTILEAGRGKPLDVALDLVQQMLQALAYLHRRGVIHRDLKPGNVMVVDGRVKVLDFGIAMPREHDGKTPRFAGTLGYMAPELLLLAAPHAASDLYSVGVILYELFTGRFPFDRTNVVTLSREILSKTVDLSGIDPRMAPVVGKLLQKEPAKRFASVEALLAALGEAMQIRLGVETQATRESFLQAARLVGRERELDVLHGALAEALEGRGAGLLVGGESGVGKSRLLDELRARALVAGFSVLRGQEVSEGAGPYQGFREVLRFLALLADPGDPDAGVLAPLIPDIEAILEREVLPAPELDPETAHTRLLTTVEAVFRRYEKPVLVILEDLHWAGGESLKLLARLSRAAPELPLLLVGTFRDDERPKLPSELPNLKMVKLGRLPPEGISALCESMLGAGGRDQRVLQLLQRETEGNPFFLVEVVRALAEEAGELGRVGQGPLPETVFAGGLARIVERRLDRVPPWARGLLRSAAVIGRRLEPELLMHIAPGQDFDAWIAACTGAAVIEFYEGFLRFAHDKLREGLLANLKADEARGLHHAIAQAIEEVHKADIAAHYPRLALHWSRAEVPTKAISYLVLAGQQSLDAYASQAVVDAFTQALAIDEVLRGPLLVDIERARWHRHLADGHYSLVQHDKARAHYEQAIRLCGFAKPRFGPLSVVEIGKHIASRYFPPKERATAEMRERCIEALRAADNLQVITIWQGDRMTLAHVVFEAANIATLAGPSAESAFALAMIGYLEVMGGLHGVAIRDLEAAVAMAEEAGQLLQMCSTNMYLGMSFALLARFDEAQVKLKRADDVAKKLGAGLWKHRGPFMLAEPYLMKGEYGTAAALFAESAALAIDVEPPVAGFGACMQALCLLRLGAVQEALALIQGPLGIQLIREKPVTFQLSTSLAAPMECALATDDHESALTLAAEALALGAAGDDAYGFSVGHVGHAATAMVYLTMWERRLKGVTGAEGLPSESELAKNARKGVDHLKKCKKLFPSAEPRYWLVEGLYQQLTGKPDIATDLWLKSIQLSQRLKTVYEEASAWYQLGRHARGLEQKAALTRAARLFAQHRLVLDEARCRALL